MFPFNGFFASGQLWLQSTLKKKKNQDFLTGNNQDYMILL